MKLLRLGSIGSRVTYLVEELNRALYITTVTDQFTEIIERKVKKFQTHKGLVADGVVGPATWGALGADDPWLRDDHCLLTVPMAYERTWKMVNNPHPTGVEKDVISSYNKFAKLIAALSNELLIEPATAHAVVATESSGNGIAPNGKMIIRFETHIFWRKFGKYNASEFNRWFSYNKNEPWKDQTFNNRVLHTGDQVREWDAFGKAESFDNYNEAATTAACESVSMGLGQLMGFHWKDLGFESSSEMFLNQARGEREQLLALFDFIKRDPEMLTALQEKDWWTFAYRYNGPGQPNLYSKWLSERYQIAGEIV